MVDEDQTAVAVYSHHFLPVSSLFIYRQTMGVRARYRPIVLAARRMNDRLFPFEPIYAQDKRLPHKVRSQINRRWRGVFATIDSAQSEYWLTQMRRNKVRLLHAHFGENGLAIAPLAARMQIPLLVSFHGVDASSHLRSQRYVEDLQTLWSQAYILTPSSAMQNRLATHGLPRERARILHYGIPIDEFPYRARTALREKIARKEHIRFLQVSRFEEKKGHVYTLEAFHRTVQTYPQCTLTLAGDGSLRTEIERQTRALGLTDKVIFPGAVDSAHVSRLMREADIYVHHSVTAQNGDQEGIPNSIMEAMSSGLISIATYHAGIPELIEDGHNGLLVEERDVEGYVLAIRRAFQDNGEMGVCARETVKSNFNLGIQNQKLIRIYDELVGKGQFDTSLPSPQQADQTSQAQW